MSEPTGEPTCKPVILFIVTDGLLRCASSLVPWDRTAETAVVSSMVRALIHRGPDHQTVVSRPPVVLGHSRLAIIDLDPSSNQPMTLEAAGICIVFNGEIYNFKEIRRELEGVGAQVCCDA